MAWSLVLISYAIAGIQLDYDTGHIQWYDRALPMHLHTGHTIEDLDIMEDIYNTQFAVDLSATICLSYMPVKSWMTSIMDWC